MSEAATTGQFSVTGGAGSSLLAERRRQGLSLGDISRQLKLSVRQVEAIERDDYSGFGGPVFVHGFIRNYAKLLNLDPDPLVRAADRILNPPVLEREPLVAPAGPLVVRRRKIGMVPAASAGAVVAVVVVAILVGNRGGSKPAPEEPVVAAVEQAAQPTQPVPAPKSAVAPSPSAARTGAGNAVAAETGPRATLRMVFDQESWVEIKDRNGNTIFGQLSPAGSRRSVSGEPPFDVVVGNAAGVRLTYKDENVDLSAHTQVDVARLTLE
ncbi:MAG TPA: RodZ domain-containing protein [Burkholderiales bacterium]|nr:RodZ domain-containing protein [Burkholderiales bacterium]